MSICEYPCKSVSYCTFAFFAALRENKSVSYERVLSEFSNELEDKDDVRQIYDLIPVDIRLPVDG